MLARPRDGSARRLAKAVAGVNGLAFFDCGASSLLNRFWGESEKLCRTLFDVARELAPSVIFLDEVDALASSRDRDASDGSDESSRRLTTELLQQMDGLQSVDGSPRVVVVAATNLPWDVDDALRRRLEKRVYAPPPDAESRAALLRTLLGGVPVAPDVDYRALAAKAAYRRRRRNFRAVLSL